MQIRVKTSFATDFGTYREGELITVSQQEAVGFLKAGLAEPVKDGPSTATVPGKNVERAVRAGGRG